ncbi:MULTISPECIES: DHA2 family efflux MFS transporter permease subunit [Pseudomonas]|uniref:DHA2 family efflux MFS transporter permease subunit n=1 Tax=Pseudomonas TaxID=286 RepID=UPI0005712ADD|nr:MULTISPECIES: DHA2 family efflux MFS transporter permease subunit [Pseudomonas]MBP2839339.1 DHA2 family efflux MFS transporter permease subunit [Pseudomonas sp. PNP]MCK2122738.1 DHA2 family efflux MFS transporter permease subunit [Pseudomonas sp. PNPG3]QUN65198.1 DHA2 family efflux MFS transporter permease subunit [Pseudomonas sp. JS425]
MPSATAPSPLPDLTGSKFFFGALAVSLATFMNVLDSSIANVAIPTISGNLGVSVDEGTWVITLFAAANAISIPLTGWLSQRLGQVRLFVAAILLFSLASWLCGIAPTLPILLAARVLQGIAAGPLVPLSQSLLLGTFPKHKSSSALSLWAMTATVGPIAGPALGGWITDSYSWSWIFYVNIPVGLFAAGVIWAIYRDRDTPGRRLPIDLVGLISLIAWVGSLQIMLDKGKDLDWFSSPLICALAVFALVSFLFFLIWELTDDRPIIDLRLFTKRNFLGGTLAISVAYAIFFGNLVLLPQWIQGYLGYRSVDAGLVTAPLGIFAVILAPVMGKIMPKTDARILATLAFLGFAGVFFMRSHYTTGVDAYTLVLPTLLQGIPTALFFVPLTAIILSGLPPEKIPAAAGLSNFVRIFAGAVGTSLLTTGWNHRTIEHHARLAEQLSVYNPTFTAFISSLQHKLNVGLDQALAFAETKMNAQAAMLGLNDMFWLSSVVFVAIVPLIWITHPQKQTASAANVSAH